MPSLCPCGSGKSLEKCCQLFLNGQEKASSPEQLMRSRYTAFALSDIDYLVKTSSKNQSQLSTPSQLQDTADSLTFIKLEVIYADKCQVEFKASYLIGDKLEQIHERSDFVVENDEWKYDTGIHFETPSIRIKRNDPCPCGSGKKFKKCHQ